MKKQTKTAMKLSVIAMIVSAFMMLAACTETVQKQKIPGATYMGGNNFGNGRVILQIPQEKMRSWKIHGQILGK